MKIITLSIFTIILILSCQEDPSKKINSVEVDQEAKLLEGKKIVGATFASLSTALQKAMAAGGVPNAVQYCKVAALPLTDSLSKAHNVTIKRTTDRWRQPKNKPSAYELAIINEYKKQLALNEALKPAIHTVDKQSIFYAPIITQGLCLKCHGEKEAIPDYLRIQEKYPNDQAVGYKSGDLRGIWSIAFRK